MLNQSVHPVLRSPLAASAPIALESTYAYPDHGLGRHEVVRRPDRS